MGKGDHRNYNKERWNFSLDFGRTPVRRIYVEQVIAKLDEIAAMAEAAEKEVQPDGP